jgi:hypothetical protein
MFHIDYPDRNFMTAAAETMQDRILSESGWEPGDQAACTKLEAMGNGGTALVVTGADLDTEAAEALMLSVLEAEIDHWVPGASQRLILRASAALGFYPHPLKDAQRCVPGTCTTAGTWVARKPYMRCTDCGRFYRA